MQPVQNFREQIITAKDPWEVGKEDTRPYRPFVSQVVGGLYLGNDEKFAEVTGLPCRDGQNNPLDTSNPNQFEVIISLCPYSRMVKAMPDLTDISAEEMEKRLKERGITWIQLGQALPDDENAWWDIIFNTTKIDSDMIKSKLVIPHNSQDPDHLKFRAEKKDEVLKIPRQQWFQPVHELMRQAAFSNKKTLIHCHAGASRSPAVVASWLIKDFQVSVKEALIFLRSKRYCSNPKCIEGLDQYHNDLYPERAEKTT